MDKATFTTFAIGPKRTFTQNAANGSFEPIVLKNSA
jgi:hypothetical protein